MVAILENHRAENILKLHTVLLINATQIRCANIITMEKATCTGACCVMINRSADEEQLLKQS